MTVGRPAKYDDATVLDRASDLLWRDGADAVTVRDLEVALDLKAPSIYRRFGSRDALIARSVDRYVERVVHGRIRRFLDASDDPVDGLRTFFTSVLEPLPGETTPRGCLLTVTAAQHAYADATIGASVDTGFAAIRAAFRRTLDRARDEGRLRGDTDLDVLADALLIAFEGLLVLARSGRPDLGPGIETTLDALLTDARN